MSTECREGATVPGPSGIRVKVQIKVGGGNGQGLSENKKPKDNSVKSEKLSLSRPPRSLGKLISYINKFSKKHLSQIPYIIKRKNKKSRKASSQTTKAYQKDMPIKETKTVNLL